VQFGDLPETAQELKGDGATAAEPKKAAKKSKKPKHAE
jgi:hypothetical protein